MKPEIQLAALRRARAYNRRHDALFRCVVRAGARASFHFSA
jgi:hypothetical protein